VTWILAMVALLLLSNIDRNTVVFLSLITAAFATVIEADSWRGFDNYFVPVGVLFLITNHANSSMLKLMGLALSFVVILSLLRTFGCKFLGLSEHTARAYTGAIFMITAVTEVQNLILPLTVLLVQTWTRSARPSDAKHPDLDVLAMLATISFVSLIGGQVMGRSAISFHQIACASLALQFLVLAVGDRDLWVKITVLLGGIATAFLVLHFVWGFNGAPSSWHRNLTYFAPIMLLLTAALPAFRPQLFDTARFLKTGLLAAIPMVLAYLIEFQLIGAST
jgi:phytol kinase